MIYEKVQQQIIECYYFYVNLQILNAETF